MTEISRDKALRNACMITCDVVAIVMCCSIKGRDNDDDDGVNKKPIEYYLLIDKNQLAN